MQAAKEDKTEARARLLYQRGRALNVRGEHSPEAESLLSKAVKLDPAMVEAWNELGEAHWKRGDIDTAKTCFEGAVRLVRLGSDRSDQGHRIFNMPVDSYKRKKSSF